MNFKNNNYPKIVYDGKGYYGNQTLPEMICECGCGQSIKIGDKYIRMGGGAPIKTFTCVKRYVERRKG